MKFVPPDLRVGESVFYWQEDPSKIQQGRKSGKQLKVEIIAVKGPMVVISAGASIYQVNASKLRRLVNTGFGRTSGFAWANRSTCVVAFFWRSKGCLGAVLWQISFWVLSLDRQGLPVAAPVDLRTKKRESFSPQLLQGFWSKLKKKNPKTVVMYPTVTTKNSKQKRGSLATVLSLLGRSRIPKSLVVNIFSRWDQNQERFGGWKKGTIPSEKVSLPMDSPAWKETQVDFS